MSEADAPRTLRPATAAGSLYPQDPEALAARVDDLVPETEFDERFPKALIVPHGDYADSGVIAGRAYALLSHARERIERALILGPGPEGMTGLALPGVDGFETPLGVLKMERGLVQRALTLPQVHVDEAAHAAASCIEVQLPFLQVVLDRIRMVPLLVGAAEPTEVAELLGDLWGGPETLIVIASDLGRSADPDSAKRADAATATRIKDAATDLVAEQATGCHAINGLNVLVEPKDLSIMEVGRMRAGSADGGTLTGQGAWAYYEHHFRH